MSTNARTDALRLLGRRDYTAAELRARLLSRDHLSEEVDDLIRQLTDEGLVDDRRAADAYVRRAAGAKGRGRLRIERELEMRGIDRAIIREAIAGLPPAGELAAIERLLARARLSKPLSPADRRRVFQQLLRRGFPSETIARALRSQSNDD